MKVLVTGGAGFIGSFVVEALLSAGHQPVVVDNLSTGRAEHLRPSVRLYCTDVLSPALGDLFANERPEVVLHLAAQVSVAKSLVDPTNDATVNLLGALNVLEASVAASCRKLVYVSSAAVYGSPLRLPIDEAHPQRPLSPYGASKHAVEHYLPIYQQMHGLDFTILRLANVYGPRQEISAESGVITHFVHALLHKRILLIEGDGQQSRDFVYVKDVAEALVLSLSSGSGETVNVGTGHELSVLALLAGLERILQPTVTAHAAARPGDIKRSVLECSKAERVLGWTPRHSWEMGLMETVASAKTRENRR